MFLSRLRLRNFRSCDDTTIHFDKDLTILVGENSSGKTNVLESLRLLTSPSDGRRVRYPEPDDVRRNSGDSFRLEAEYADLDDGQRGLFLTALKAPNSTSAIYGLQYTEPRDNERRGTQSRTVGPRDAPESEPGARELIRHVHLPALRDAVRELASGGPGRIEFLLRQTSRSEHRQSLLEEAREANEKLENHRVISEAKREIQESFGALTSGVQPHDAHLGFAHPTLMALARDLRFRLALAGLNPAELAESGMGYANLLFLSAVLVELRVAQDAELTLFLVEEPEAHLHPQLQAVTLAYLRDQAIKSAEPKDTGTPAGRIQVIVTTHSPHLTAAVSATYLAVLRSLPEPERPPTAESCMAEPRARRARPGELPREGTRAEPASKNVPEPVPSHDEGDCETGRDAGGEVPTPETIAVRPRVTRAVSVARLPLTPAGIAKIDRYLDVTRSALLFARRVLLVEGIAEALLVPAFGALLFADGKRLARMRAATIVSIDGVDFEPYVRLLLAADGAGGARIADRVVVITDADPTKADELEGPDTPDEHAEPSQGPPEAPSAIQATPANPSSAPRDAEAGGADRIYSSGVQRRERLYRVAGELGARDALTVELSPVTLEACLMGDPPSAEAEDLLRRVFLDIRPRSVRRWRDMVGDRPREMRGEGLVDLLKATSTRKGDFAQRLAAQLRSPATFSTPPHFVRALEALVGD